MWFAVQSSPVQTWLVKKISNEFSKRLHTKISIKHVDFSFFNKVILDSVLAEDRSKDTLLYADNLKVLITDWFFLKDSAQLKYIGLNNATIKLQRSDSVWNYQFIIDYFSKLKTDSNSKGLALNITRLDFSNLHVLKKDGWRGEDMNLNLQSLQLDADKIDLSKKIARINLLEFSQPDFSIANYVGNKPKQTDTSVAIKNDPLHLRLNPGDWDITAKSIVITNGFFKDDKLTGKPVNNYFDGEHIFFDAINIEGKNFRLKKDTITANLVLSTKERCGIEVKKLSSDIKFYPEAMEFAKMDLQTKNSRLRNFFAMRFNSLDDMSYFLTKIKMEADFTNADINSDDIAFFAPDLRTWKKNIRITGSIKGTVSDLNARNITMTAGKNSLLNGNIHMTGLPDINKTMIDFKSNDFRTTYGDVVTFIPSLKNIQQPRIDRIEWLRFTGNFKGSVKDFVTTGTIQTNLGTIVSNVNMTLNTSKPSVYSGTISTDSFNLGKFLDNDQLGKISFTGKINGEGLTSQTLNATVDGTITQLYFNDYTYNNIIVNGTFAKSKFNGQIISNDSNLNATMNGLIDFSKHPYTFNFYADVTKADFAKLNIIKQKIQFNGKLDFNFTGDNIDNFIGAARIYNATILKSGQRISFDSLIINSSIAENNKTITLESNEFNGAFVGDFSIRDLPSAFQTFLNKYYPSYISPAKTKPANQDFSFVISTRKVQDYIDLFDKKLKGFDNATVSGRISSKENMLDLNVDVPRFSYDNIAFTNVSIKGRGSLDSLSMQTDIGDVAVNDSLHFPGTHIHLRSANDFSDVQILTSANQTLNSAKLSAQVQTLPTGIHIKFNPSTFDINSKTWTIDKDGQLTLSRNLVEASNLKIHSDDQQILVTTHPSSGGNWNDIHLDLKKINMGDITPFFIKSDRMEGLLTGSSEISNPYAQPKITFAGQMDQFRLDNDSVGKLEITGDYDTKSSVVNARINSDNKNYHFNVNGIFKTSDSNNVQPVDVNIDLSDTKIGLLEKYLSGIFSNMKGNATGKLQIVGGGNNLKYIGNVQVKNAEMKVNYTQCTYRIPLLNVALKDSSIDFGTFQITDKLDSVHHTAEITQAKLYHHAFTNMRYDFAMNTNKLLLLDTKVTDNNLFYGRVIGRASLRFTGRRRICN